MAAKQVMNMVARKGMTIAESNEYQRRWSNKAWDERLKRGNYDRSRDRLNFEIARGGKVQDIDKSASIPVRMKQNLALRGLKDRNEGINPPKFRTLCSIVFSGSRDRMREIAFGDQDVDWKRDADNSHLQRKEDIEKWAQDCYDFACSEWGEDNIVGFYVHLDETTPHAHCVVIPYDKEKNKISYKNVFTGKNTYEYRDRTLALHDRYYAMVGSKWGLNRGDSIAERGNLDEGPIKHEDPRTYITRIKKEAREYEAHIESLRKERTEYEEQLKTSRLLLEQSRKRVKSLNTMVDNLEEEQKKLTKNVESLRAILKTTRSKDDTLSFEIIRKREELDGYERNLAKLEATLADKREKLEQATEDLNEMESKVAEQTEKSEQLKAATRILGAEFSSKNTDTIKHFAKSSICDVVMSSFSKIFQSLDDTSKRQFADSDIQNVLDGGQKVVSVASMLFFGMVGAAMEATQAANAAGGGGGGGGSDLPWDGRRDDEDDTKFMRRCVSHAAKLCSRSRASRGRRR